ncbi:MAG: NAD(P)/FAD-dependent oxidoreductase [Chitinophagaceae bacterium]
MKKRLIVIGGGAAGFFCAVNAARLNADLEVIILEKTNKILSKVKVSGGGRCNVTHACYDLAEMVKGYPRGSRFLNKAFRQFFTTDTIRWFEERGVALKTEEDGRMFPLTDSSQTIINCLITEVNRYGVQIMMNADVKQIIPGVDKFSVLVSGSPLLTADYICVASGGYPRKPMFEWLSTLGHSVEEPVPSLFTLNMPGNSIVALMGISVEHVVARIAGTSLQQAGPLLITHWGMSGPVILKLSAWGARELATARYECVVIINWVPLFNENSLREEMQQIRFRIAGQKLANKNPFHLPQRLWEYLLEESGISTDLRWADLPGKEQNMLIKNLCVKEFTVKGKTTFKEEFVTSGGINLGEVDNNTLMSKVVPGLFFAGEVLNVDGITGGYNFQHAWTSGYIAAKSIAGL